MTETGSGVVYDGVPLDGVETRIVDGIIHLRCPMLMRCYRDGSSPVDADGWLRTGDMGSLNDDGTLRVDGREGDLIITGGENVWPEPVEAAIDTHPAVVESCVVGADDPEWGQAVHAFVVVRGDLTRGSAGVGQRDTAGALRTEAPPRGGEHPEDGAR